MDKVDIILLMSVNPGFGGQAFIPATLEKAREARKMIEESGYDISLEIDGGVGVGNIKEIAEAGVDMFVAGSAIFNSDDYKTTIDATLEEVRQTFAGWTCRSACDGRPYALPRHFVWGGKPICPNVLCVAPGVSELVPFAS